MRERLAVHLGDVFWSDLRAHAARDALIVVDAGLALLDVGEAVARDEKERVGAWIAAGKIGKPTAADLARWEADPTVVFESLVVAPFVLARPRSQRDPRMN